MKRSEQNRTGIGAIKTGIQILVMAAIATISACLQGSSCRNLTFRREFDNEIEMKIVIVLIMCVIVSIGNAQTKNYEFSSLSERSILTIEINNYSESAELQFVRKITDTIFNKKSKIYFTIEEIQKDVAIKFNSPERFTIGGPIKRVSDKKKNPFFFNTTTNTLNRIVPISLLIENKDEINKDFMETLSRILKAQQIEEINKKDIEFLLKKSHSIIIITYKMESLK